MNGTLFELPPRERRLAPGAVLLGGFAREHADAVLAALAEVVARAPFRHMETRGGHTMSVAMTNCGALGRVTDRTGYRYAQTDPESGLPWPPMPGVFLDLATGAAGRAGFPGFAPEACLVNRYEPGARMALHQDRDERDFSAPIVSVSLGLPAVFQFGGMKRSDPPLRLSLEHGDVLVWGGPDRLCFHGVLPLADGQHAAVGRCRINLTFRRVG